MPFLIFFITLFFPWHFATGASDLTQWDKYKVSVLPMGYGGGGRFTAIAIAPEDPDTLFVGSDVAGVFKSKDGGKSFELKGNGLKGFAVADIAFHPSSSKTVFLLTGDGFYISEDQGESWKKIRSDIRYVSRIFGSHLMVFSKYSLWIGTNRKGLFQIALDTPAQSISPVPGLEGIKINGLAIYQRRLYAGTSHGVYRYEGGSWRAWNHGLPPNQREIVDMVAHYQSRLYIVEKSKGLYSWDDKRAQWHHRSPNSLKFFQRRPKAFKAVAVHPTHPDKILLAIHPETWPHLLFITDDGGKEWKRIEYFQPSPQAAENWPAARSLTGAEEILFTHPNPRDVYMADWWNVWKSRDGGLHWSQLHQGLQNTVVNDVKTHPRDTNRIYLCVWDNGLMVSNDGGKVWKRKMSGVLDGHAQEIEISRQNPLKMYLLMNPWFKKDKIYVYKSLDGGKNWQEISFPIPPIPLPRLGYVSGLATNLEIDPFSDDTVYVATNGYGIFKSRNGGNSWQAINNGLDKPYVQGPDALLIHPRNPKILFASTQEGGIFKTTNGGISWLAVNRKHPFTFGMAIDPSNPSRIIAGCPTKKVILSEDEGRSWREIQLPGEAPLHISSHAVAFHPAHPGMVLIGTSAYDFKAADGLFISLDNGRSFNKFPLPQDLPRVNINEIAFPTTVESTGFIGFSGIGLYRLSIKR